MSWHLPPSLEVGVCQSARVGGASGCSVGGQIHRDQHRRARPPPRSPVRAQGHPLTGAEAGLTPAPAKREMGATTFRHFSFLRPCTVLTWLHSPYTSSVAKLNRAPGHSAPRSSSNLTPNPSDGKAPRSGSTDEKDGQDGRAGPGHRVVTRL